MASYDSLKADIGDAQAADEPEDQLSLDASHYSPHTLVSLPTRFEPVPPAPSTMEGRLARIEAKLDERAAFAEKLDLRMARLETLLVQLVGGQAVPS
jgi:hypothetical protein